MAQLGKIGRRSLDLVEALDAHTAAWEAALARMPREETLGWIERQPEVGWLVLAEDFSGLLILHETPTGTSAGIAHFDATPIPFQSPVAMEPRGVLSCLFLPDQLLLLGRVRAAGGEQSLELHRFELITRESGALLEQTGSTMIPMPAGGGSAGRVSASLHRGGRLVVLKFHRVEIPLPWPMVPDGSYHLYDLELRKFSGTLPARWGTPFLDP